MSTEGKVSSGQKEKLQTLLQAAASARDMDQGRQETSGFLYQEFSLETRKGRNFYGELEDSVLLGLLRERARELDHSPSQKEVFWVLREYIRKRFRRWPYALEAAGLKRSSGSGGRSWSEMEEEKKRYRVLLGMLRQKAKELCRIPHPSDVPDLCAELKKYEKDWSVIVPVWMRSFSGRTRSIWWRIWMRRPEVICGRSGERRRRQEGLRERARFPGKCRKR